MARFKSDMEVVAAHPLAFVPFEDAAAARVRRLHAAGIGDIAGQAIPFLEDLELYDAFVDVRLAADIFSVLTNVPGRGVALGRYNIQPLVSVSNEPGAYGPNEMLWVLKHELGHSFGWLGVA